MTSAATRVALVVGATSGIGRACAVRLAAEGFRVLAVGRDAQRGAEVVAECNAAAGGAASASPAHEFLPCDASRVAAVRQCAAAVASRTPTLDVLVLSQGIATLAGRTETAEGLDTKLVIHYFGRVAFIQALLPQLSAARGRVLSVLSAGVHGTYAHYADDFELRQHYSLKNAADAAGLYNDAALHSLALETPGVAFCHAAPGIVRTRWGSEMPTAVRVTVRALMACLGKPPAAAADALVPALLRAPPGFSLIGPSGQPARRTATHDEMRPVVWSQTLALLRRIQ